MNTRTSLITITSLTATFVALCAAVFSVTGIAKLFAGAAFTVAIMASALELGKIVSISFLYQYWSEIPKALKYYLTTASFILMVITSAGIYGYLSSAYAKVAATPLQLSADIATTTSKVTSVEQDIVRKNNRLNQLISLRAQQETRLDNLIGKSTTGNTSSIRSTQAQLVQADKNVVDLQKEITVLSSTKDSLSAISTSTQVEIETNGDIGTFVYIAKTFGVSLDTVVKWFTLVIVLVFDPLAVALVIAINFLLKKENKIILPMNKPIEQTEFYRRHDVPLDTTIYEDVVEPYKVYVSSSEVPPQSTEPPTVDNYFSTHKYGNKTT